ncbi:MAG: FAD-binding oxidoreductase [Rhodospirillales bacterium]|nr:FAD-binding oxidoreductase [Rhodospirillales bacterium]
MAPYLVETRGLWRGQAAGVVRPGTTEEVASVVRLAAAARLPIVPQGGNTGLLGGGVPDSGIVLSTSRLNRVRDLDATNHTLTVEAGCVLADIQRIADEAGFLFPLSLAAEGSCQIGGNLSTNAGGVQVLRFGNARDLVLGLEVVMPDGRVWSGLRGLRKDNTGYDLKQIFIGAEGTLGIITAAVLKLFAKPKTQETAFVAAPSAEGILQIFTRARDLFGDALVAFEMVPRIGLEFTIRHIAGVSDPLAAAHPFYALIEIASPRENDPLRDGLERLLTDAIGDGTATDAVVAASVAQSEALWRIRETIPEAQRHEGASVKHDVAVPVSQVAAFVVRAGEIVEAAEPGVRVVAFGHVGDGNIHFNLSQPLGADPKRFLARCDEFNRMVHDLAVAMGGTFSAEHGIGRLKRGELVHYKSEIEIELMRRIKTAFDPLSIMNPGKVI